MTFTEAAVEILRRAGKALHFKEIAEAAVRENLLSHVGPDPEAIMGQRLAAMARREEDRKVVSIEPVGTFALTEWKIPSDLVVEPLAPPLEPAEALEKPYRPKEREPRPIHAQARKRLEALQGIESDEEEPRRRERDRDRDRDRGPRKQLPAEAAYEWLAARGTGAPLVELAEGLGKKGVISDGLAHDPASLTQALLEDNRRRTEAGRKPAFIVDGERVTLVEFPPPGTVIAEEARAPQSGLGRPATAAQLVVEGRRAVVRALRQRLSDLETLGFEQVCAQLLEKMGMRDVRVAKRSKEGPLYLARQKLGISDLRVAVRLVRGRRELGRADIQELRKDLSHYSQQMGIVLAPGDVSRDVRAEASASGQPPIAVYAGEALAEEMVDQRVGVTVQTVEIADVDEAFFLSASQGALQPPKERREEREPRGPGGEPRPASEARAADGKSEPGAEAQPSPVSEPAQAQPQRAGSPEARPAGEGQPRPSRDENRRRDTLKLSSPADQAWGQPAGTPKKALLLAFQEGRLPVETAPAALPAAGGTAPVDAGSPDIPAPAPESLPGSPPAETPSAEPTQVPVPAPESLPGPSPVETPSREPSPAGPSGDASPA